VTVDLDIRDLDFEAKVELAETPRLELIGNADGTIVAHFAGLILDLHHKLVETNARAVTVDIRALEFMNASCFNVFVNWIGVITELPDEQRYRLDFEANPAIPWQRRSLKTLACFATDLVGIDG
jgi:hypothetical protein